MTNTRILTIGALIAALAAVLAAGVQRMLGGAGPVEGAAAQVMSTKSDLPAGHRLAESDLEPKLATVGSGPKAASTDARALAGRTLSTALRKGQVVRQEHLAAKGSGADIAAQLPAGHRAITVVLRDPVAASSLFPGAWVDVLVTMDRGGTGGKSEAITRVAIERARVVALADDSTAARAAAAASDIGVGGGSDRRPVPVKKVAVTLDVTAEQAAELELASSRGTVGLAIRPAGDTASANGVATTQGMGAPTSTTSAPSASASRATTTAITPPSGRAAWDVIVIRGDDRVKHEFPERPAKQSP